MKISYYLRHKTTGEIVPVEWKALESYHLSYVHFERPIIYWQEWHEWERYKPTTAERRAVHARERLTYLRYQIEDERISYSGIAELQSLAKFIDPSDTLLLEWAGVPEEV